MMQSSLPTCTSFVPDWMRILATNLSIGHFTNKHQATGILVSSLLHFHQFPTLSIRYTILHLPASGKEKKKKGKSAVVLASTVLQPCERLKRENNNRKNIKQADEFEKETSESWNQRGFRKRRREERGRKRIPQQTDEEEKSEVENQLDTYYGDVWNRLVKTFQIRALLYSSTRSKLS